MMTILLGDGICNEINVLTSNFIPLGYQLLDEIGCHHTISFYLNDDTNISMYVQIGTIRE